MSIATTVEVTRPAKPILFSGPMIRAILEARKSQTRRVVKGLPKGIAFATAVPESDYQYRFTDFKTHVDLRCPYGRPQLPLEPPQDRLWVRESFYAFGYFNHTGNLTLSGEPEIEFVDTTIDLGYSYLYAATDETPSTLVEDKFTHGWHKRPSIFMPCIASRLTLGITHVRVERLHEISEADAIAEGMRRHDASGVWSTGENLMCYASAREAFANNWDSTNARRGYPWANNPFVWIIEFKKI